MLAEVVHLGLWNVDLEETTSAREADHSDVSAYPAYRESATERGYDCTDTHG